jgi:hypothetical protein
MFARVRGRLNVAVPVSGPIEELNLSVRTYNALKRAGFLTIEQVAAASDDDLIQLRNFSRKCRDEVREKMAEPDPSYKPWRFDDDGGRDLFDNLLGTGVPRRPAPGGLTASAAAKPEDDT